MMAIVSAAVLCLVLATSKNKSSAPSDALPAMATRTAGAVQLVGRIRNNAIQESSGIVASRTQTNVFWTHNDKGNRAAVFAIARDGSSLGEFRIEAKNQDWEDIAADAEGNLYIGSIGNNDGLRGTLEVLRFREPDLSVSHKKRNERITVERTWKLKYPGQRFDCESLFVYDRNGYVISKVHQRHSAMIYRFPLERGDEVTLEPVVALPTRSPVTAADLSANGNWLAVMSAAGLYLFEIRGDINQAGQVQPQVIGLPKLQFEAVCFTTDGVLMTAESREIFFYGGKF